VACTAVLRVSGSVPGAPPDVAVEVDERPEAPCLAADDRDHQRETEETRAGEGRRRAADAEPDRQRILQRSRVDALSGERRPVFARPLDVLVVADREQELELLLKERVVVLELVAEQREGLDERATPDDHLRAAVREQVERRELLKYADRVRSAEDGHRAREANALGAR